MNGNTVWLLLLVLVNLCLAADDSSSSFNLPPHTNNWAVLVCTSTFWFNYRHVANVLSIYQSIKWLGIPDDHIILMLADDMACNPRNVYPAAVFNHYDHRLNVYGGSAQGLSNSNLSQKSKSSQASSDSSQTSSDSSQTSSSACEIEVDYRGSEVTVETFIRLLTNRLPPETPRSKRLETDAGSNVLIYMTGHGGNNFLKFQDSEEINAHDLADAFEQMYEKRRYRELLFIIDTCQAATMYEMIRSPNILAIASSVKGESSYSYHVDEKLGVPVLDRFTYAILQHMQNVTAHSPSTIANLMASLSPDFLGSSPAIRDDLFKRHPTEVPIVEFFGNIQHVLPDAGEPIQISTTKESPRLPKRKERPGKSTTNKRSTQKGTVDFQAYPVHPVKSVSANAQLIMTLATGAIITLLALTRVRSK